MEVSKWRSSLFFIFIFSVTGPRAPHKTALYIHIPGNDSSDTTGSRTRDLRVLHVLSVRYQPTCIEMHPYLPIYEERNFVGSYHAQRNSGDNLFMGMKLGMHRFGTRRRGRRNV